MSPHRTESKRLLSPSRNRHCSCDRGGRVRTYDMGGKDSTLDVAKAIADYASS
jgi:hypothetical protein